MVGSADDEDALIADLFPPSEQQQLACMPAAAHFRALPPRQQRHQQLQQQRQGPRPRSSPQPALSAAVASSFFSLSASSLDVLSCIPGPLRRVAAAARKRQQDSGTGGELRGREREAAAGGGGRRSAGGLTLMDLTTEERQQEEEADWAAAVTALLQRGDEAEQRQPAPPLCRLQDVAVSSSPLVSSLIVRIVSLTPAQQRQQQSQPQMSRAQQAALHYIASVSASRPSFCPLPPLSSAAECPLFLSAVVSDPSGSLTASIDTRLCAQDSDAAEAALPAAAAAAAASLCVGCCVHLRSVRLLQSRRRAAHLIITADNVQAVLPPAAT